MDGLVALEETANDNLPDGAKTLPVKRWRPLQLPDLPAVWNWAPTFSPSERKDTAAQADSFLISVYIGVEHSDDVEQMAQVELYADVVCQLLDVDFRNSPFLDGAVHIADRTGRRLVIDTFGNTDVLCIELPLRLLVTQIVNPSG
jgi:hypothetical protein